jgi:hypothetical protein
MRTQARNMILAYADEDMQRTAALTGEHTSYVNIVLTLLRDDYKAQVANGNTEYVINEHILEFLDSIKPF